jgi:hypothetical protein
LEHPVHPGRDLGCAAKEARQSCRCRLAMSVGS